MFFLGGGKNIMLVKQVLWNHPEQAQEAQFKEKPQMHAYRVQTRRLFLPL